MTLLRRATSATVALGSALSARIRIFSSLDRAQSFDPHRADLKACFKVGCRTLAIAGAK